MYVQVSKKEVTEFNSELIPRLLELEWVGEGEFQCLSQKVFLKGSKNPKFLTIRQPSTPIVHPVHSE